MIPRGDPGLAGEASLIATSIDRHKLPMSPGDTAVGSQNDKKGGRAGKNILTVEIQDSGRQPEDRTRGRRR